MKPGYRILTLAVVLYQFANSLLFAQDWNIKIRDIDTSAFPKTSVNFVAYNTNAAMISSVEAKDIELREGAKLINKFNVRQIKTKDKLAVAILLDVSGSMKGEKIENAKLAAEHLYKRLQPGDESTLITFGSSVDIVSGLTSDFSYLAGRLNSIQLSPRTKLYDALFEAAKIFSPFDKKINAIILLTDGKDEGSLATSEEAITELKKKNIEVFSIGTGNNADMRTLGRISEMTNSSYFGNISPDDLSSILENIYSLLTTNYQVTYATPDSIVEVAYTKRDISIFLNYNQLRKNDMMSYTVPKYNPYKSDGRLPIYLGIAIAVLVLILIVVVSLRRKKSDYNFVAPDLVQNIHHTPDWESKSGSNGEETESWEDRLKEDIKEKKTVIINKGKFQTDESLGYLVMRSKKFGMHVYEIKQREVIVGRGSQADIFIDDDAISRIHTKIREQDNKFIINDLGSSNGTYLNGEMVYHAELKDGDIIGIGEHELIFKCID